MQDYANISLSISHEPSHRAPVADEYCWTNRERRQFMNALSEVSTDTENFYEKIASKVPNKSARQVQEYFESCCKFEGLQLNIIESMALPSRKKSPEYFKPCIWTKKEHMRFLMGFEKYGKGQWNKISKNYVWTKSPSQVSVYAHRYLKHIERRAQANDIIKISRTTPAERFRCEPSQSNNRGCDYLAKFNVGQSITETTMEVMASLSSTLDVAPIPTVQEDGRTLNLFPVFATQEKKNTLNLFPVASSQANGSIPMNLLPLFPM